MKKKRSVKSGAPRALAASDADAAGTPKTRARHRASSSSAGATESLDLSRLSVDEAADASGRAAVDAPRAAAAPSPAAVTPAASGGGAPPAAGLHANARAVDEPLAPVKLPDLTKKSPRAAARPLAASARVAVPRRRPTAEAAAGPSDNHADKTRTPPARFKSERRRAPQLVANGPAGGAGAAGAPPRSPAKAAAASAAARHAASSSSADESDGVVKGQPLYTLLDEPRGAPPAPMRSPHSMLAANVAAAQRAAAHSHSKRKRVNQILRKRQQASLGMQGSTGVRAAPAPLHPPPPARDRHLFDGDTAFVDSAYSLAAAEAAVSAALDNFVAAGHSDPRVAAVRPAAAAASARASPPRPPLSRAAASQPAPAAGRAANGASATSSASGADRDAHGASSPAAAVVDHAAPSPFLRHHQSEPDLHRIMRQATAARHLAHFADDTFFSRGANYRGAALYLGQRGNELRTMNTLARRLSCEIMLAILQKLNVREMASYSNVDTIRARFKQVDADGNGEIDQNEFIQLASELGIHLNPKDAELIMAQINTSGAGSDGAVDFEDFQRWWLAGVRLGRIMNRFGEQLLLQLASGDEAGAAAASLSSAKAEVRARFERFDVDGDGELDVNELQALAHDLSISLSLADAAVVLSHLDVDLNHRVSFDEFYNWFQKLGRPAADDDDASTATATATAATATATHHVHSTTSAAAAAATKRGARTLVTLTKSESTTTTTTTTKTTTKTKLKTTAPPVSPPHTASPSAAAALPAAVARPTPSPAPWLSNVARAVWTLFQSEIEATGYRRAVTSAVAREHEVVVERRDVTIEPRVPGELTFVVLSDTHTHHSMLSVPDGDVLLHCGDFTMTGKESEVAEFSAWLETLPHAVKIVIAGNHETTFEPAFYELEWQRWHWQRKENPTAAREALRHCYYLEDDMLTVNGVRIYGSPWQPWFMNWAFNKQPSELAAVWERVPANVDILMTHGPPLSILDRICIPQAYKKVWKNVGDAALLEAVQSRIKCKVNCFGHVHESYGRTTKDGCLFINACNCNHAYFPGNPAHTFTLKTKK